MKRYRNGSTDAQWEKYYSDLAEHEKHMERTKPDIEHFQDSREFDLAFSEWEKKKSCEAPNPPGYQFANNH